MNYHKQAMISEAMDLSAAPHDGQIAVYNSTTKMWVPQDISTAALQGPKGDKGDTGNSINFVDEETPSGSVVVLNTVYTLAHTPVTGSVHTYVSIGRLSKSLFSVSGNQVTILTSLITGAVSFDYRY